MIYLWNLTYQKIEQKEIGTEELANILNENNNRNGSGASHGNFAEWLPKLIWHWRFSCFSRFIVKRFDTISVRGPHLPGHVWLQVRDPTALVGIVFVQKHSSTIKIIWRKQLQYGVFNIMPFDYHWVKKTHHEVSLVYCSDRENMWTLGLYTFHNELYFHGRKICEFGIECSQLEFYTWHVSDRNVPQMVKSHLTSHFKT